MAQRATTPVLEAHEPQGHYPIPNRSKVQGAVGFCDRMGLPYYKEDVFRIFGVYGIAGRNLILVCDLFCHPRARFQGLAAHVIQNPLSGSAVWNSCIIHANFYG